MTEMDRMRPVPLCDVLRVKEELVPASLLEFKPSSTCIEAFFGTWEVDNARSDCVDDLLKALGVGILKRRFLKTSAPRTEITPVTSDIGPGVLLHTRFKLGVSKEACVALNGGTSKVIDDDTEAEWTCHTGFDQGLLLQLRHSKELGAHMADIRVVYERDPLFGRQGPVCLFRWIVCIGGEMFVKNRWMVKVA